MGLFQKNPYSREDNKPLYTLGLNKTVLLVGLGNPGKKYDGTRHNIGFGALDAFAASQDLESWLNKKDLKSLVATKTLGNARVIIMKPTTYMNNSGEAVQAVAHFYKVPPEQIAVVHDEIDIPFGQIRTRVGGSSAGHNGIQSVSEHIGEVYGRVRIGIGPKSPAQIDSADFVLAPFSKDQQEQLPGLYKEAKAILSEYLYGDHLTAETRNFLV